jgi:hypothetical protein
MKKTVSLDIMSRKSGAEFAAFAQNVLARMLNNPRFESLQSLVEGELKPAVEAFTLALQESADRSSVKLAEKRAAHRRLEVILQKVAFEVDYLAEGEDETLVLDAGFRTRTPRKRMGEEQAPPTGLVAETGLPGIVKIQFNPAPPARVYAAEWRLDGEETWHNGLYPAKTRFTIEGLPSRKDVWVRISAVGSNMRLSVPCDPVKVFVL